MIRENRPDSLRHLLNFTLPLRMGFIADEDIKAVTDKFVRLERKLADVLLIKAHHFPYPVSPGDDGAGITGIFSPQPEG
ncbi:TPA: hypothetical protein MH580_25650 [Klebsiella pneumoniae]|nr:hypothetical protein [Klebsiella pneumoniae]